MHFGTTMNLRGTITAELRRLRHGLRSVRGERRHDVPDARSGATPTSTRSTSATRPASPAERRSTRPATSCSARKTRVYGSQNLSATDGADGEDRFIVYYLQTMNVAAGHTLTLDGQAETDNYAVYTTGSQGSTRDYVINVLDTGAEDDGVDELAIYGKDTTYSTSAPTPGTKYEADDIFLLRAATVHRRRARPAARAPRETADRPAYVALLAGRGGTPVDSHADLRRRQRPRLLPRHDRRQRAERVRPADQLRHRAQRPADGLRPRRQRRLLRRRHDARSSRSTAAPATTASRSARSSARSATRATRALAAAGRLPGR